MKINGKTALIAGGLIGIAIALGTAYPTTKKITEGRVYAKEHESAQFRRVGLISVHHNEGYIVKIEKYDREKKTMLTKDVHVTKPEFDKASIGDCVQIQTDLRLNLPCCTYQLTKIPCRN